MSKNNAPRSIYRDGLEQALDGPIRVTKTRTGHVVERYSSEGKPQVFVTLAGTPYCAHGTTVAEAVADALWKDPSKRPSREALKAEIQQAGPTRKISLREFQLLTGACSEGCRVAIQRAGVSGAPMTATAIRDTVSKEWGTKLLQILEWDTNNKTKETR